MLTTLETPKVILKNIASATSRSMELMTFHIIDPFFYCMLDFSLLHNLFQNLLLLPPVLLEAVRTSLKAVHYYLLLL